MPTPQNVRVVRGAVEDDLDNVREHIETLESLIDGERDELYNLLNPIVEYLKAQLEA